MYGWSRTVSSAFSGGISTEIAVTSGFATITSAASLSPKTKTLSIICCSSSSISPSRVERETSIRSSASERTSRSAPAGVDAEDAEHGLGGLLEHPDERLRDGEERAHRRGHPQGRSLRVDERDALRHELAEDDVEERQDEVGERDREGRGHPRVELLREHVLAESTDGQRGERDAELHRRDEPRRVAGYAQHVARAAVPLMVQLDDPRPPRRHEPVLGRDEERVQQDQGRNAEKLEEKGHGDEAAVLGGLSPTS